MILISRLRGAMRQRKVVEMLQKNRLFHGKRARMVTWDHSTRSKAQADQQIQLNSVRIQAFDENARSQRDVEAFNGETRSTRGESPAPLFSVLITPSRS